MDNKTTQTTWGNNDVTFSGKRAPIETKNEPIKTGKEIPHTPSQIDDHKTIFDNVWLKVKQIGSFIYAERKGIDSVAFVLLDKDTSDARRIGLTHEFKDPIGCLLTTAFGGSIDDEKYHADLRVLVKDEVIEEAGFDVALEDINYHGKVFTSTQMNQYTHLFSVNVNKSLQGQRTTTNVTELMATIKWLTVYEIKDLQDWKAITIITKRMMQDKIINFTNAPQQ